MDDGTGPAALDASGNGQVGVYQPSTVLQVPGPEAGTFGVACPIVGGGVQLVTTNPIVMCTDSTVCAVKNPVSMMMWVASQFGATSGSGRYLHIGAPASNGLGLIEVGGVFQMLYGGSVVAASTPAASKGPWHLVALTYNGARYPADLGTQSAKMYLDLAAAVVNTANIPNPSTSANPLVAATPEAASIAHAAFWMRELSVTEVQSVYTSAVGLQSSLLTGRAATDFDVSAMLDCCNTNAALLASILAAVSHTY